MADKRLFRSLSILIFTLLSGGTLLAWYTDHLFPWLSATVLVAAAVVMVPFLFDINRGSAFHWGVAVLCVIGIVYRVLFVLLPDTLPGKDPDKYALFAQLTMQSGSYHIPDLSFYGTAGGFHTYIAETALVTGLSPEQAMGVVGVALGVWSPLMSAGLVLILFDDATVGYTAGMVAAVIGSIATISVLLATVPVAQSIGTILFVTLLFLILKETLIERTAATRITYGTAVMLTLLAMALSHKIPVLIATGTVSAAWLVTTLSSRDIMWPFSSTQYSVSFGMVVATILTTAIQQQLVSSYVAQGVWRIRNTLMSAGTPPIRAGGHPSAASVPDTGILTIFDSHSHAGVSLLIGMVACIAITRRLVASENNPKSSVVGLLTMIGALTMLVAVSLAGAFLPDAVHPVRIYALVEIPLVAACGTGFILFRDTLSGYGRRLTSSTSLQIVFLFLILFLSFHAFASVISPDYPGQQRLYLTNSEMSSKEFTVDNVPGEIHTDTFHVVRTPYRNRIVNKTDPWVQLGGKPDGIRFESFTIELVEGTLIDAGHETLIYRPNADIYQTGAVGYKNFRYEVQWDVEAGADREYNRVYDSDGGIVYRNTTV